ncbi:MAG: FxLYD domain-containing protein [Gemmatimonadaceae bacterium]|nr:FxLYD domain-containing protein [Gemmatimonadaceae bacterium]
MSLSIRLSAVAALAALVPVTVAAQATECSVDLYKPSQLAQATIFIQQAANNPEGEDGAKALRDAARLLQDERRFASNPNGLAYAKGQMFILWLHQDDAPVSMTERDLNLGRDRERQIDLVHAADSMFSIVERAAPECEPDVDRWRQSKPWNERISEAYRLLNEGDVDGAEDFAKQAFQLDRRSPFVYNAFAQIAAKRNDVDGMLTQLDKAIELASKDTALAETTRQLQTQYAQTLQTQAMSESAGPVRNEKLAKAARMYIALGNNDPMGQDGPAYFSAAMDIASMTQNQALMAEILQPLKEDPSIYPDLTLLIAAETSRLLNKNDDAMAFYQAALEKNPNIRDANFFLAYMLIEAKKSAEALPMLERLKTLDPGNPDNLMMQTMAARQVAEAEQNTTRRAELIKNVEALMRQETAMQHRVQITRFERRAEGAVVSGSVENRGRAAKTFTLEFQFLDIEGNVVETLTTTTPSAEPNGMSEFEITATQPGIVAWKYVMK